jgi:hypothetical protein
MSESEITRTPGAPYYAVMALHKKSLIIKTFCATRISAQKVNPAQKVVF